jgi:hypothetical protein
MVAHVGARGAPPLPPRPIMPGATAHPAQPHMKRRGLKDQPHDALAVGVLGRHEATHLARPDVKRAAATRRGLIGQQTRCAGHGRRYARRGVDLPAQVLHRQDDLAINGNHRADQRGRGRLRGAWRHRRLLARTAQAAWAHREHLGGVTRWIVGASDATCVSASTIHLHALAAHSTIGSRLITHQPRQCQAASQGYVLADYERQPHLVRTDRLHWRRGRLGADPGGAGA